MYDKYSSASQFSVNGSKLPKHKGLLFINSSKANSTATMQIVNANGSTGNIAFQILQETTNFLPIEAYAGVTLGTGVTGWLLN